MIRRHEKALTLNGVTAPNVQTEGNETATIPLGKGTIMLEATTVPCTIIGCTGPFYDESSHADENPEFNLHYADGYDGDLPLEVHPVMDSASWPYWSLTLDVPARGGEHTPAAAIAIAQVITEQAERVQTLNDAIDAQEWFDTHPNPGSEPVATVMRTCGPAVCQIIVARMSAPPVTDYSGHNVATSAGFVVHPESILMQSLVNGDEARSVDRSRYLVNA